MSGDEITMRIRSKLASKTSNNRPSSAIGDDGGTTSWRPRDFPETTESATKSALIKFRALNNVEQNSLAELKQKRAATSSPVKTRLSDIVQKKVEANSTKDTETHFEIAKPDEVPAAAQGPSEPQMVDVAKVNFGEAQKASSPLFYSSTFEESGTNYRKLSKPEPALRTAASAASAVNDEGN